MTDVDGILSMTGNKLDLSVEYGPEAAGGDKGVRGGLEVLQFVLTDLNVLTVLTFIQSKSTLDLLVLGSWPKARK